MKQSLEFLEALTSPIDYPAITFVTTKWDAVAEGGLRACVSRESTMKTSSWAKFLIDQDEGARYSRHYGVGGDEAPDEAKARAQQGMRAILRHHRSMSPRSLRLGTLGQGGTRKTTTPSANAKESTNAWHIITGVVVGAIVVGGVIAGVATGNVDISFDFGIEPACF